MPKKKATQTEIPGAETMRKDAKLHGLAVKYADVRDERMQLNKDEAERKAALLEYMIEKDIPSYKWGPVEITREPGKDTIKVKIDRGQE